MMLSATCQRPTAEFLVEWARADGQTSRGYYGCNL